MAIKDQDLGGRLPLVDIEALSPVQQRFYEAAMAEQYPWSLQAGFQFVTDDHRLIGPYNAFLRRPEVAEKFQEFAKAEAQRTTLSPQLREVVILAVGSAWGSDYEVHAHRILARATGIPAGDADALAAGRSPAQLGREAELVFALARQLTTEHRVDQALYDEALAAFGAEGLVDIAALIGVYLTVSAVLNLFAVPAPDQPVDSVTTG
ncbi:carboxymuconolactone decarboxylase family protein [Actinoplanes sp. N902-109]|uniref:carboxymuconolactone decarboxylase family protein n=1 Tax=Actinoplanes sp. (strain N902-109) TaxID=649831 RepID=UPI0003294431|nr:carboxymuconolactone decarboxylase family protein [Actinoplanes sp. N902-109]AGL19039.1 carboxymuconolactone decarboxylase [Actinoplanes sp. N902-109]